MIPRRSCLFIDDNPLHQSLFLSALNDVSPQTFCITVSNCCEALDIMTEENVFPSYIFVELDMPGMNGLEFLKTIKSIDDLKGIPVIVHSNGAAPHEIVELKESGATALYSKPYEYFSVCNMLTLYLQMAELPQN